MSGNEKECGVVLSVQCLHECETPVLQKRGKEIIKAFEMLLWRRMERIKWTYKVSNEEILNRIKETELFWIQL